MKMSAGYGEVKESSEPKSKKSSSEKGEKRDYNMNVRKIENGWIVRESWSEGEGDKQKYQERERFTEENPIED